MPEPIAELLVKIGGDVTQLQSAFDKANSMTKTAATGMSSSFGAAGASMATAGEGMAKIGAKLSLGVTLPLTLLGKASMDAASQYDGAMAKIGALTATTATQLKAYDAAIRGMKDLPAEETELANALFFVASAGFQGSDALTVLEQSARASAAGLGTTGIVADAVTSALNSYKLNVRDSARITDVMTQAVVQGKMSADSLAPALGRILPIAAAAGVSFEEVAASMATMTRTGLSSEEAATSLRGVLSALIKPGKEATDMLASLGYSAEELTAAIREKGLMVVLGDLMTKTNGNIDSLGAIIPNIRALTGVLATAGSQGAEYAQILAAMGSAAGTTANAFATMADSNSYKMKIFTKTMEDTKMAIGDVLLPMAVQAAGAIGPMVEQFSELDETTKKLIVSLGLLAAVSGPAMSLLGGGLKLVGGLLPGLVGGIQAIVAAGLGPAFLVAASGAFVLAKTIDDSSVATAAMRGHVAATYAALGEQGPEYLRVQDAIGQLNNVMAEGMNVTQATQDEYDRLTARLAELELATRLAAAAKADLANGPTEVRQAQAVAQWGVSRTQGPLEIRQVANVAMLPGTITVAPVKEAVQEAITTMLNEYGEPVPITAFAAESSGAAATNALVAGALKAWEDKKTDLTAAAASAFDGMAAAAVTTGQRSLSWIKDMATAAGTTFDPFNTMKQGIAAIGQAVQSLRPDVQMSFAGQVRAIREAWAATGDYDAALADLGSTLTDALDAGKITAAWAQANQAFMSGIGGLKTALTDLTKPKGAAPHDAGDFAGKQNDIAKAQAKLPELEEQLRRIQGISTAKDLNWKYPDPTKIAQLQAEIAGVRGAIAGYEGDLTKMSGDNDAWANQGVTGIQKVRDAFKAMVGDQITSLQMSGVISDPQAEAWRKATGVIQTDEDKVILNITRIFEEAKTKGPATQQFVTTAISGVMDTFDGNTASLASKLSEYWRALKGDVIAYGAAVRGLPQPGVPSLPATGTTPPPGGVVPGGGAVVPTGGGHQAFASGIDAIVHGRQNITVGESGPERLTVTPLTGAGVMAGRAGDYGPAASRSSGGGGGGGDRTVTVSQPINVHVYNPVGKPTERSVSRELRILSALGILNPIPKEALA